MRSLAEQVERIDAGLEPSPWGEIDRRADHTPARELFLPGPDALRVQELNETIAQEAR